MQGGTETTAPLTVLGQLEAWGSARSWVGPDPYEGLNSLIAPLAPGRVGRQAVTQAYKRLPFRPPWPLRADPRPNAKALALALSGYASEAGQRLAGAGSHLELLPRRLRELNLLDGGAAWGYPFDVQTRNVRYDARTPNAIATCFVVQALCDAAEATGRADCGMLALASRGFLLSLLQEPGEHGPYFAYVPAGAPLIHNANLLVCGALARLHGIEADTRSQEAVERATETTLALTRPDGLWPYGEVPNYDWTDNFHTAYVLEGISHVNRAFDLAPEALARGVKAWSASFLEPDGWARYYPDRRYPLEAHCCASAIDLLCLAGPEAVDLGRRVAETAIRELWLPDEERFAFRRTARGLNRREFMRWTNAPMFGALAALASSQERQPEAG